MSYLENQNLAHFFVKRFVFLDSPSLPPREAQSEMKPLLLSLSWILFQKKFRSLVQHLHSHKVSVYMCRHSKKNHLGASYPLNFNLFKKSATEMTSVSSETASHSGTVACALLQERILLRMGWLGLGPSSDLRSINFLIEIKIYQGIHLSLIVQFLSMKKKQHSLVCSFFFLMCRILWVC